MKSLLCSLFAFTLLAAQGAMAHDDATLDAMQAPHGGQLRMAGAYHFELVVKADEILVYVTDHAGTSVPTQGASGRAIITSGPNDIRIPLQPTGDNLLAGAGRVTPAPDAMVMVSLRLPGQRSEMAHFLPFRKSAPAQHAMH